jgi:predicted RNase H-like HicB family nuclease
MSTRTKPRIPRTAQATEVSLVARLNYWKDGSWYVGQLRDVPDVFSQGRTLAELRENIRDAYDLLLTERSVRARRRRRA